MELESTTLTYGWICIFWFSIIIWKSSRCTTYWTSDQFFQAARTFIFCWRTPRTSVAGYKIGIINLLCFLSATCIDTMNIADSFQFVIRPCTTFVAPVIFFYIYENESRKKYSKPGSCNLVTLSTNYSPMLHDSEGQSAYGDTNYEFSRRSVIHI